MNIAVNTRFLIKDKLEGIGWFTFEILKRMVKNFPEHKFYFIFDQSHSDDFVFAENVHLIRCYPPTRLPFLITTYFQFSLPLLLKRIHADIYLSMDGWTPCKLEIPVINVIHDINFVHHKEFIQPLFRNHFLKWFPLYAKNSTKIVTVSQYSKHDIVKMYGIKEDKISIVYNGINDKFRRLSEDEKHETRNVYTQGCPYFIFIGRILPRKNLERTLEAFCKFKHETNSNVKFVVVGSKSKYHALIQSEEHLPFAKDIIFLGRQSSQNLKYLLGSSLALTYISLFEGFGIPILEGFQAEVPVITSNVTSMPEIAADAAYIIDPYSTNEIMNALKTIAENEDLRKDLIRKGKLRVQQFSWEESAKNFTEILKPFLK